jgi:glutamine amidotransferase
VEAPVIQVIDYDAGNLNSVLKALNRLNRPASVIESPETMDEATFLILPGVGAFGNGMGTLKARGFIPAIHKAVDKGIPFLGICLGMQLLFEESYELGHHQGLGLFPGAIVPFDSSTERVPHMGWNRITGTDPVLFGDKEFQDVYFVHSFYKKTEGLEKSDIAAMCDYTEPFVAAVRRGVLLGMQFHPEKSGDEGIAMLERCLEMAKC